MWSSGMIPALGAGGPGFKPRLAPSFFPKMLRFSALSLPQIELGVGRGDGIGYGVRGGIEGGW